MTMRRCIRCGTPQTTEECSCGSRTAPITPNAYNWERQLVLRFPKGVRDEHLTPSSDQSPAT